MKTTHLVIYGFGNLGYHLLQLFWNHGFSNLTIISNKQLNGREIKTNHTLNKLQANQINSNSSKSIILGKDIPVFERSNWNSYKHVLTKDSLIFLCLSDQELDSALDQLENLSIDSHRIVLSGAFKSERKWSGDISIFYPLYSFSINSEVDWSQIPVFVESPNDSINKLIQELKLPKVYELNSTQRNLLHVSAVFANNFTNAVFIATEEILKKDPGLKMEYLMPIIQQTIDKNMNFTAIDNQTGPAKRNDENTMSYHLQLLNNLPDEQMLYSHISNYIRQKINKLTKIKQ